MTGPEPTVDVDALWEYGDPAASEQRFRAAIEALEPRPSRGATEHDASAPAAIGTRAARLELMTQLARTFSLRRRFDEAHSILDEVERQLGAGAAGGGALARARVRLLLERGRAFNSAGERERARALFTEAWTRARATSTGAEDRENAAPSGHRIGLAVDAAHMIAITHGGGAEAIEWNRRGLELARRTDDAKARGLIPAMLNNNAWDLHDLGRFDEALAAFEEARDEWTKRGREPQIRIARWSVARCLRSLERHDDALAILRALESEPTHGARIGFTFEEIAENLDALGRRDDARPYFRRAAEDLSKDAHLAASEPARLARLAERGREH